MRALRSTLLVGLAASSAGCRDPRPDQPLDAPGALDAPSGDAAIVDAASADDAMDRPGTRLRLIAGNLTSGSNQAYEAPGIRIFDGLDGDVVMIQELNVGGSSPAELAAFAAQAFGAGFTLVRGTTGIIPNGIASRYPVLDSGEWLDSETDTREFSWAQIDIPGPIDLYAVSVHLLTENATRRNTEAVDLLANLEALPDDVYVVVAGDFNTAARDEPCIQTLAPALVTTAPYPVDQAGDGDTNAGRNRPYDWVLAGPALDALEVPVAVGAGRFPAGLVVDTRRYMPIADLTPAQTSDSGVTGMQHMAVVRDFLLPVD